MPEQALYLKWRPLTFTDVVGQEHVTRTLRNSLKTERIRHAYLFSGPRGTGKTTSARLLAKAVNCTYEDPQQRPCNECATCIAINEGRFLDLIEIDAASHTGVDDVRDLRDKIAFAPGEGRYKVYIIDEVHRFSGNAFDALLKTLEEPPDHALFVLATTEIDKVPATIKSRCLQFEFRRLSLREVYDRLSLIAESENLQIEPAALELIAREGTGSVRDSISLLDQIVADPEETITLELAQRILGTASLRAVRQLVEALVQENVALGLHIINEAVDAGSDPRQFGQQIVEQLRAILLVQTAGTDLVEASDEDRQQYAHFAGLIERRVLLKAIRAFSDSVNEYSGGWQPQLGLELALIETLQPEPEAAIQYVQQAGFVPSVPRSGTSDDDLALSDSEESLPDFVRKGEPPVVPPAELRDKWVDAQRLIQQNIQKAQNQDVVAMLPSLMDHVQVHSVDGNTVILTVNSRMYLDKLNNKERIRWIERALLRLHDKELRVYITLADALGNETQTPTQSQIDDPIVEEALSLGGQIQTDSDDN